MPESAFHGKDAPEESHLLEEFVDEPKTTAVELSSLPRRTHLSLSGFQRPQWSDVYRTLKRFLFFLLPTFIQHKLHPDLVKAERLHPSAYLDGMRGLAALFVFFYHLSYSSHDVLTAYAGTGKPDEHRDFPLYASSTLDPPWSRFFTLFLDTHSRTSL